MADDAAALLIRIEASQAKVERQMAAIARRAAKEAQSVEDRFKKANDNVAKSFKDGSDKAVMSIGATRAATANLSFQLNDIATSLAGGASPFTVMMQQGGQVAQVFQGSGGVINAVKLLGGAFASVLNPVSLASFAIIGLTGAAYQYFSSLGSDTKDAEEVLKGHSELIRRIKDAYGEAAAGAEEYSAKSRQILAFDIQERIREYKDTIASVASDLNDQLSSIPAGEFKGATYIIQELQGALNNLREGIKNGDPDIRKFINRLIDIENQTGTPESIKAIIREIINSGKAGEEVQSKLETLTGVITGVGTAAKRQADNVSAFTKSVRELANIAIPALSEMEKAEKAYSDALRNATTREERDDAYRAFQAAQERIRVAQTIPTPGQRPNPESFAPERERRTGGTRSKKVKDSFDELDDIVAKYVRDVVKAESGGRANAKNPLSSATGLGQFIESTWLDLFKKNFPDRAKNMSDQTILALRNDAEISKKLIEAYARENAAILRQAGVSVNEAALQLAHFLGPKGAISVLTAKSGTLVSQVLPQSAISANQSILGGGKTVDDVIAYAQSRVSAYDQMKEAARAYKLEQKELNREAKEFANLGKDLLGGFIDDLRNGASASEALANALQKVASKLIDIALNNIFSGGGLFGGGKGGLFGGAIIPGILHSGGVAGTHGYGHGRAVSPSVFAGAKRYHTGGVAGLQPGEIPAILQRGEVVLPRGAGMVNKARSTETINVVLRDDSGRMAQIADQRIQTASGAIVQVSVQQSAKAVQSNFPTMLADAQARKM
ncbi:phage tail length tape measure family protein [Brucella intermedia]|uniref:phage tail length tape measure family protein n=1 Tax=Brucella intermedia TaxID=94625 RepID=UPI00209B76FE|nr:phage tail length tape measure family protein [Brucella intermedia]MCO7737531.1 phage tail length tape measure family protein [Brucella intermedia]